MQRIDENTYIDDTLVTCAEYQLFIDEMREQGKYYQPDHWTSHQFSEGQALDPVLGIRSSDAQFFCAWLTTNNNNSWHYRLPQFNEGVKYPITKLNQISLGYWVYSVDWKESKRIILNLPKEFAVDLSQFSLENEIRLPNRNIVEDKVEIVKNLITQVEAHCRKVLKESKLEYRYIGNVRLETIPRDIYFASKYNDLTITEDLAVLDYWIAVSAHQELLDEKERILNDISVAEEYIENESKQQNENDIHLRVGPLLISNRPHTPSLAYSNNRLEKIDFDINNILRVARSLGLLASLIGLFKRCIGQKKPFEGIRLVKERIR